MRSKKDYALVVLTAIILVVIICFSVLNWNEITYVFSKVASGADILQDYVISHGVTGVLVMGLVIIICFFFPVISSIPVQLASVVSYGLPFATFHVATSIFLASQLTFLFSRTSRVFLSKRKRAQQKELEEKIQNSNRSIMYFLILAYLAPFVPFLVIHTVAAGSGMKWWKYSLVTLIGSLPDIVVTLWAGDKITSASPVASYLILVVIIICVVLSLLFKNKIVDLIFTPRKEKKNGR